MKEKMTKLEKVRAWAKEHRGFLRFAFSTIFFFLTVLFFIASMDAFYTAVPDYSVAGGLMAGVILLMIAGFFWRGATDFSDWGQEPEEWEERVERALHFIARRVADDNAYIAELRGEGKFLEIIDEEEEDMHHRLNKILDQ